MSKKPGKRDIVRQQHESSDFRRGMLQWCTGAVPHPLGAVLPAALPELVLISQPLWPCSPCLLWELLWERPDRGIFVLPPKKENQAALLIQTYPTCQ